MKDIHQLIDYLRTDLSNDNVNQAAIILRLLEKGGRTTKTDLVRRLTEFDDSVQFYYEGVLNRATDMDVSDQDAFTYDPKTDNYFLNVSLTDTYLVETATKLCRAKVEAWRDEQEQQRQDSALGGGHKLVRDKIPDIITESGRTPITETLSGDDLREKLLEKLNEEHIELLMDFNMDEISDMIEVLLALGATLGQDETAILQHVRNKRDERGGFSEGIYLKGVQHPDA